MEKKNRAVAVVVNSGDQNGYGVVSNLGKKGIRVLSVDSNPQNITFYSKYAEKKICPNFKTSENKFINFLVDLGKNLRPNPVLFITGDLYLLVILRRRKALEPYYHIPYAEFDIVQKLVDKVLFYKTLATLKVPHAETYLPKDPKEVRSIAPNLDYPFIIKAVHAGKFSRAFGNKCLKTNDSDQLTTFYEAAYEIDQNLIVQKELSGTERYLVCFYMDRNSTPLAICCYQKIRIMPIDYGNAVVCRTTWEPEAVDICISVLKAVNFSGLCEGEVQRDLADGRLKLTEINARSTTEARLAEKWGVNMEYLVYQDAVDEAESVDLSKKRQDVVWIDIIGDIRAVFSKEGYFSQKKLTIPGWIQSMKGKRTFAYFNGADPLPFLVMLQRFIQTFILKKDRIYDGLSMLRSFIRK